MSSQWSNDRYTAARVAKLRAERTLATDSVSPVGVIVPAGAVVATVDRDIRRALVGDTRNTRRTEQLPPTSRTESVAPASRGLEGMLPGQVVTQGSPVSLANVRAEAREARAEQARANIAANHAASIGSKRAAKRAARRSR